MATIVLSGQITRRKIASAGETEPAQASYLLQFNQTTRDGIVPTQIKVDAYGKVAEGVFNEGDFVIVDGDLIVTDQDHNGVPVQAPLIRANSIHPGAAAIAINRIVVAGNVGQAPRLQTFDSGKQVANFTVAEKCGKGLEPTWVEVSVWGKSAEVADKHVKVGNTVQASGVLSIRRYQNGKLRLIPVITGNGNSLRLLGGAKAEAPAVTSPSNSDIPF